MKKFCAIILTMILLGGVALAEPTKLTETASGFDASMEFPTDTNVESSIEDDMSLILVTFADEKAPLLTLSIAPSEEYDDLSLDALSEEELQLLFENMTADLDDASYEMGTTANGYRYMDIRENGVYDIGMIVTIYDGYFIQASYMHSDFAELSQEDEALIISTFDTLQIQPVK